MNAFEKFNYIKKQPPFCSRARRNKNDCFVFCPFLLFLRATLHDVSVYIHNRSLTFVSHEEPSYCRSLSLLAIFHSVFNFIHHFVRLNEHVFHVVVFIETRISHGNVRQVRDRTFRLFDGFFEFFAE